MKLINRRGLALVACAAVTGLLVHPGLEGGKASAAGLYVLGPEDAVAKALKGEHVRACAPAVVTLPEHFEHLRTPPGETAKAVALRICEVMVVEDGEVQGASRALADLDVAVEVASLSGSTPTKPLQATSGGAVTLASATQPGQLAATPSREAEALFFEAFEALQQNRIEASIDLFERGLRLSPTNHLALYYLGTAYEANNQPARARPLYERVSAIAPESQEAAQARERLTALRAAGGGAGSSGRFATGIFIDPASPPEDRSIRDVFERSPMAAGERQGEPQRGQELPASPLPPLQSRPAPRIQAPAVPADDQTTRGLARVENQSSGDQIETAAADETPTEAAAARARPRLSSGIDSGSVGTGRLSTRIGAARVPPRDDLAVEGADMGMAPQPESRLASTAGASSAGANLEGGSGREEARLTAPVQEVPRMQDATGQLDLGGGAVYVGSLEAGRPHGQGRITYADGSTYEGTFVAGERTGTGVFTSAEGWRYEGQFRSGRFDGRGTLLFADGATYRGEFRNGARTGTGIYTWPSGARYEGEFDNGTIVGPGVFVAADGTKYEGEFADGRRTGEGTLTLPDGRIYVGRVINGLPEGRGSFYWPDGRRFAGEFSAGAADGAGTMVYADGRSESGVWTSKALMADVRRVPQ